MPALESNPLTPAKVDLGRRLFFDKRLSHDEKFSLWQGATPKNGSCIRT